MRLQILEIVRVLVWPVTLVVVGLVVRGVILSALGKDD
jgi:hypothetical protein